MPPLCPSTHPTPNYFLSPECPPPLWPHRVQCPLGRSRYGAGPVPHSHAQALPFVALIPAPPQVAPKAQAPGKGGEACVSQFPLGLALLLVELCARGNLMTSMEVRGKPSGPLGSGRWSPYETWNWRHPQQDTQKAFLTCVPGTSQHLAWQYLPEEGQQPGPRVSGQPSPPLVGSNSEAGPLPLRKGLLIVLVICTGSRASRL